MRTYQRLKERGAESLKRRLIRQRGPICYGCGGKRRNRNLIVCVVDPEKEAYDSNLILLDTECQNSLVMIMKMLYGRDRTGIEYLYDCRAGEGKLDTNRKISKCSAKSRDDIFGEEHDWHKWVYGGHRNPCLNGRNIKRKSQSNKVDQNEYGDGAGSLNKMKVLHDES